MNPEVKQEWIVALRSGKYKQGRRQLKEETEEGAKYCCLGVLCDLAAKQGICKEALRYDVLGEISVKTPVFDTETGFLPESVKLWAQIPEDDPLVVKLHQSPPPIVSCITYYNDVLKYDFKQLADLIEKYL